jgi:hypothetical protein
METKTSIPNGTFRVQFALKAIVEVTLDAKDFTSAIEDAKAYAKSNGFLRKDIEYQDGSWEVIGVSLEGGWDILVD